MEMDTLWRGHSLVPLIQNPDKGKWTGPDVAITALPGKDHMLHKVYEGSLYPHFSVRGKRYRYSLASDGGEELYDHQGDPYEWSNLANHPEYASIKADLRKQLEVLRDGGRWQSLERLGSWTHDGGKNSVERSRDEIRLSGGKAITLASKQTYEHFEFETELKAAEGTPIRIVYREGDAIELPLSMSKEAEYSNFKHGEWNRYRIRVHGDRHQLWINNRVVSDTRKKSGSEAGAIRIASGESKSIKVSMRNARARAL